MKPNVCLLLVLFCLPVLVLVAAARAGGAGPAALDGVGVDQKLGDTIPLDLPFTDDTGKPVRLRDLLHGRPIILTPVYYKCPMLCTVTLNQLGRTLTALSETVGEQFDIVTFSIDARDTAELAAGKKRTQLRAYRRPSAAQGWAFLTGPAASIHALTDAIGFRYRWDEPSQQFVHAGAVLVLTPEGKITRYFLGVDYPPTELRAALQEARAGTVSTPAAQVFLYCFRYDPATGRYGLIIDRGLKVLGVSLVLTLAGTMVLLTRLHRRRLAAQVASVGVHQMTVPHAGGADGRR